METVEVGGDEAGRGAKGTSVNIETVVTWIPGRWPVGRNGKDEIKLKY